MSRADRAIELYVRFNHYLKDIGSEPAPLVQVQDNLGRLHIEDTWPPEDMTRHAMPFTTWERASGEVVDQPGNEIVYEHPGFAEEVHISGASELRLTVQPTGNGGQICARPEDAIDGLRPGMCHHGSALP